MGAIVKFLLATVLLANAAFAANPLPPAAALPSQQGLARLFFSSRITAQDPQVSMACFTDYIEHSNQMGGNYGKNYKNCLLDAQNARESIDKKVTAERHQIQTSSEGVCVRLTTCNEHTNTLDMFNCHANAGANNTKASYGISGNASEYASMMQEELRLIDLRHEQCCHTAERVYVEETASNYNHLQACLDGRVKPRPTTTTMTPTTSPSTAAPTTTSSTTTTTTTTTTEAPPTTIAEEETTQKLQEQFQQLLNLLN